MVPRYFRLLLLGSGLVALVHLAKAADTEAPTKITAEQLVMEFVTDAKEASKKYDGKTLEVEGIVNFSRESDSVLEKTKMCWVLLYGYKKPNQSEAKREGINCNFDPKSPLATKAKALKNGHKARITGKLKAGSRTELVDCTAVERIPIDKEKPIKVMAEELTKEFKGKKAAAGAADKYLFKVVEVAGEVVDNRKAYFGDDHWVELKAGADKLLFVFTPANPNWAAAKKFTKGRKVTIKGRLMINTIDKPQVADCVIVK